MEWCFSALIISLVLIFSCACFVHLESKAKFSNEFFFFSFFYQLQLRSDDTVNESSAVWRGVLPWCVAQRRSGQTPEKRWRFFSTRNDTQRRESNSIKRLLEWAQAFHRTDDRRRALQIRGTSIPKHTRIDYASASLWAASHWAFGSGIEETGASWTVGTQQRWCHPSR